MLDQPTNDTVRKLSSLRTVFKTGLDQRLQSIKSDFEQALDATNADHIRTFLTKVRHEAHKLSGSAGVYGFPGISSVAMNLDQACGKAIEHEGLPISITAFDHIKDLIDTLMDAENQSAIAFGNDVSFDAIARQKASGKQDRKTILLIDDDKDLAASLKAQLGVFGFELVWEESPNRLADNLDSMRPAAVIMDISFPDDKDAGFVAINESRVSGSIDCPVIFLSHRNDIDARLGALRAGCSDYLVKPFDVSDLVSSLVQRVAAQDQEPYRVLVVDDDIDVSQHHQALLENAGFDVLAINDPMQTLNAVRDFAPDGILLDVHMPTCSGIEIAAVLRQNQSLLHIPIIFLTSETDQVRKLSAVQSGGDDFLNKTSPPEYIIEALKTRTHRSRELKRKIEKIGRSENHFRSLAQKVADAIVSIDREGRIVQWNQGAAAILGYREEDILGLSIMDLFPERLHRTQLDTLFYGNTNAEEFFQSFSSIEVNAVTKNRDEITVEMSVNHWNADEQWYCTAIIRDITDRKKTEQELRKSKDRFRTMTEQSSDWIWESDPDHRIVFISEGLSKRVGISRDKFLGQKRSDLNELDVLKEDLNNHLEDLRGHLPFRNFEYGVRSDSGSMVYLSISGTPQFSSDGTFEGYIGTGTNVTQLKLSQAELQDKINAATSELNAKSKKLERALKKEKQVNQMQRQFVSMASHEFRTPLAIIDSTAQRMTSIMRMFDNQFDGKKEFNTKITKIRSAVERLTTLIESTLAAENIDSGKTEFNAQTCSFRSLILEVCERQKEISVSHDISWDIDALPVRLIADNGKIDQIFTNLLSNAVKYSPDANRIDVRGWQESGSVYISVTDYGLGIPVHEQSKIFDRFYRASSSLGIVGTGIGLYLVKEFVALHSGSLDITSKEDEGTTITIRLPMNLPAGYSMEAMAI